MVQVVHVQHPEIGLLDRLDGGTHLHAAALRAWRLHQQGGRVDAPVRGGDLPAAHQPFDPLAHRVADRGAAAGGEEPLPPET